MKIPKYNQTPLETPPVLVRSKGLWSGLFLTGQKGFVVSAITFFTLVIMLAVAMSMSAVAVSRQKISTNMVKSTQSYYAAESGVEDALLRLHNNPSISTLSYSLPVGTATANVVIPTVVGGSRAITSKGDALGRVRNVQTVYSVDADAVSFYYGVHVGEGGLTMSNNTRVVGNVFSNGNITGSNSASIDNDVIIAGNHTLSGMDVGGNALVRNCSNSTIDGNLTYVQGGTNNCSVGGSTTTQPNDIPSPPMPISAEQIDAWKADAEAGGTTGTVNLYGTQTQTLGPKKVNGNLYVSNSAVLTLSGTVYVTGNIVLSNSAKVKLDSSYGSLSGVILSDGTISPSNSSVLQGSGQTGSYLMVLSTNTSDSAIVVSNSATAAIFYASAGGITASNSFSAHEVTGHRLIMSNSATITYDSGLANTYFTNGPSGGWKVKSWQEQ